MMNQSKKKHHSWLIQLIKGSNDYQSSPYSRLLIKDYLLVSLTFWYIRSSNLEQNIILP